MTDVLLRRRETQMHLEQGYAKAGDLVELQLAQCWKVLYQELQPQPQVL